MRFTKLLIVLALELALGRQGVARADDEEPTPLNAACKAGDVTTVRRLLAGGASPNEANPGEDVSYLPLQTTLDRGWDEGGEARLAILQALLAAGADPNLVAQTALGESHRSERSPALHMAVRGWWLEGWKPARISRRRYKPDSSARARMERNNAFAETAVRTLLDAGANPNLRRPDNGKTPLHVAAKVGSLKLTKLLLARGADVRITDDQGTTAVGEMMFEPDCPDELVDFYESYLRANDITITDRLWRDRKWHSFGRVLTQVLRVSAYLALPLAYAGGAIYLRESYYRDRPDDNWLGTGHAYLMVAGGSFVLAGLAGGLLASWNTSGWKAAGRAVLGFAVGALLVGLPAGIAATHYGHMPHHFKTYRALYYLPPTALLAATVVGLSYPF